MAFEITKCPICKGTEFKNRKQICEGKKPIIKVKLTCINCEHEFESSEANPNSKHIFW